MNNTSVYFVLILNDQVFARMERCVYEIHLILSAPVIGQHNANYLIEKQLPVWERLYAKEVKTIHLPLVESENNNFRLHSDHGKLHEIVFQGTQY